MREILRLTLLGTPQIMLGNQRLTGFATQKAQALLFYLAVTTPIGATQAALHSRETLAALLWGEMTDGQARQNLRTVLPDLRRLVGDHVRVERQTIAFDPTSVHWLDVAVLRQGLTTGRSPLDLTMQQAAIELYQGEFLHGFYVRNAPTFEAWVLAQREQLHALVVNALAGLVNEYTQRGDAPAALAANHRLLGLEPWSEPAHRQQMALLAQTGERSAALAQYELCQRILATEFSIEPLAETKALYEQIRAGASRRQENAVAPAPPAAQRSKFKNQNQAEQTDAELRLQTSGLPPQVTGHNLPPRTKLYGRQLELARLQKWVDEDGCQMVGIFGIGGQGKTALAAAFAHTLTALTPQAEQGVFPSSPEGEQRVRFQRIIWQSLVNAPPLAEVMQEWFYVLSNQTVTSLPTSLDQQCSQLLGYLDRQRCLLVLDNLESILQGEGRGGYYRPGYEAYGQLFRCLVEGNHQSCLLLTSRERPQDFTHLEEDTPTVRFLTLAGLPSDAGQAKLKARGVVGAPQDLAALVQQYSGNPLALKLVAETVQSLFAGDIAAFLQAQTFVFDDIRDVLDQQFARLTPLERELMVWLAIVREPVSYTTLRNLLAHPPAPRVVLEAVRSLQRRLLLETYEEGFGLQNVVLEYITDRLIENIVRELEDDKAQPLRVEARRKEQVTADKTEAAIGEPTARHTQPSYLNRYALVLAQAKDYVRASQTRLLLQPIGQHLLTHRGERGAEQQLQSVLTHLHTAPVPGYAAANLLHLLVQLGMDLRGYDFSRLAVWRAYLRGVALAQVNFTEADLTGTIFTEPLGRIFALAFSPDGQYLAAGSREGTIHLWRAADQHLVQVLHAHHNSICGLAFYQRPSATGETQLWLASASEDETVGLWQVSGGAEQRWHGQQLHGHQGCVISVSFSADGQYLASVDMAGVVLVGEVVTGRLIQRFSAYPPVFRAVAFSPDGQMLAIGSSDGLVRLWPVMRGTPNSGPDELSPLPPSLVLAGHEERMASVAFHPDGQMLVSGDRAGRICLWSLPQGLLQQRWETAHGIVYALAFSPDGQILASSHGHYAVCLWELREPAGRGQLRHTLVGHTHNIWSLAFHPRPEGTRHILTSSGADQMVRLWDVQTGQALNTLRGHQYALSDAALSSDGQLLAGVGNDQMIHLWSLQGSHSATTHRALSGHRGLLHTVALSADGQTLASAGRDPAIYIWDVANGQLCQTLYGHTRDIYRVAFHPNQDWLASASADGTVRLWDWRSGQLLVTLASGATMVYAVAFSPDGRTLASAGVGHTIRFWDMTQPHHPELVTERKIVQDVSELEIVTVAFSRDGDRLACGSTNLVHLWDQHGGEPVQLHRHSGWVMALAFSPDGTTLASASEDRTIALWDVVNGTLRRVLTGHTEGVYNVVFSPNGATLLSASADGTIKFWDSQTGECVNTLRIEGPYAGMKITGVTGVTAAQKAALKALGAVET